MAPYRGFVERYLSGKENVTGIGAEPWHFRYVGYPHSVIMTRRGLVLEEYLQFLKEYNLTDGPLRADTLIIKKEPGYHVQKNIGRIFRRFNIVEYKNPWESLTVRTYYQAVSYASVLQSRTEREDAVLPEDITLTLVGNHYPRKLFRFLKKFYGARVE